ncbi:MAG TPA: UvrB/UvrC motif-containing protein, partial [Abditibacteriaceae bacterium]|nr:UvrB/UvrC motif-containing protein [Abditibacteriaceae bacterium]
MSTILCDLCRVRPASVFTTQSMGEMTTKRHLCSDCAHYEAGNLPDLTDHRTTSDSAPKFVAPQPPKKGSLEWMMKMNEEPTEEERQHLDRLEREQQRQAQGEDAQMEFLREEQPQEPEEPQEEHEEEPLYLSENDIENLLPSASSSTRNGPDALPAFRSLRCPKCGTTWDRLKQDGRAGCGQCYATFARELANVMERVQKASQHAGKTPRALEKRQRRLMHLRLRRDNRLEMLQRRLQESLERENFEEAARLRDKIKIVA